MCYGSRRNFLFLLFSSYSTPNKMLDLQCKTKIIVRMRKLRTVYVAAKFKSVK